MYIGNPEAGVEMVREFSSVESLPPLYVGVLSAWAAYFGDPDLALKLQFLAYSRPGGGNVIGDIFRPVYRDMRRLPGFKDLVRQDGLVEYWRAIDNWGDYCRPLEGSDDFECF